MGVRHLLSVQSTAGLYRAISAVLSHVVRCQLESSELSIYTTVVVPVDPSTVVD